MRMPWSGSLRAFVLDTRASAGLELGIGAAVLLGVAALCFDLYSRVEADASAARVAATMTDYVSRGPDTDGGDLDRSALKKLGKFLRDHELDDAGDMVLVVSALSRGAGAGASGVRVLWSDTLHFGKRKVTRKLAPECSRFVRSAKKGRARPAKPLPGKFTLAAGEVVAVTELCARPRGVGSFAGDIYRNHVLPVREPEKAFPAPA